MGVLAPHIETHEVVCLEFPDRRRIVSLEEELAAAPTVPLLYSAIELSTFRFLKKMRTVLRGIFRRYIRLSLSVESRWSWSFIR